MFQIGTEVIYFLAANTYFVGTVVRYVNVGLVEVALFTTGEVLVVFETSLRDAQDFMEEQSIKAEQAAERANERYFEERGGMAYWAEEDADWRRTAHTDPQSPYYVGA